MLYKHPGSHEIHGDKFDYIIVDALDVDEELKNGWKKTTTEAKNSDESEADDTEASREEMLAKAEEIGLDVDGSWSDKKLMAKITEALAALDELG